MFLPKVIQTTGENKRGKQLLLNLHLHHPAPGPELRAHLRHPGLGFRLQRLPRIILRRRVLADVVADLHRAEFRAAHGTEMRGLVGLFRQGRVVVFAGGFGVEAEVELVFPAELEPGLSRSCRRGASE